MGNGLGGEVVDGRGEETVGKGGEQASEASGEKTVSGWWCGDKSGKIGVERRGMMALGGLARFGEKGAEGGRKGGGEERRADRW